MIIFLWPRTQSKQASRDKQLHIIFVYSILTEEKLTGVSFVALYEYFQHYLLVVETLNLSVFLDLMNQTTCKDEEVLQAV